MLSVVASDILAVADAATLKHSQLTLPLSLKITEECHASAWAADNSVLYLASPRTIYRYDPSSNEVKALYTPDDSWSIRCMIVKDKSTVIYSSGNSIHMLECDNQNPKVIQSLGPHHHDILSLSLSNNSTLLACGLSNTVFVYNLATGAQTTLRGLPSTSALPVVLFHPHIRTKLLVGCRDQLLVYDTTRPSAPLKTISMAKTGKADITDFACSPFSKTLVAIAMSNGCVGLVDLDKENALFRILNLNVHLKVITFSPEGASIYLGSECGKLLIQDLRSLDKSPKSLTVSESGKPVETLAVQKKLTSSPQGGKARGTPQARAASTPTSGGVSSPMRIRAARAGAPAASTPTRKATPKTTTPRPTPSSKAMGSKNVLSPGRDQHGDSPRFERAKSTTLRGKQPHPLSNTSGGSTPSSSSAKAGLLLKVARQTSAPTASQMRKISSTEPVKGTVTALSEPLSSISNATARVRSQKTLSSSLAPSASEPTALRRTRASSSTSRSSATSQRKCSLPATVPPVLSISPDFTANIRPTSSVSKRDDGSRTPSPDLPTMKSDVMTPVPVHKKMKALAVLGLGTPEVTAWIKAGKGKENDATGPKGKSRVKSVGFKDSGNIPRPVQIQVEGKDADLDLEEDQERERERSLSLQISPRRPLPTSPSSQPQAHGTRHSWAASPVQRRHPGHLPGTASAGSAHELLRTIVKDVMYDFQTETKAELMGLHLDLVKMGRGWKQELRTLMDEYVGDLNDLREENRRLRAENEILRREY